jgi:hypothetical protein
VTPAGGGKTHAKAGLVADGPNMWNSKVLDEMEAKHTARANKRHALDLFSHPRVINVTTGRSRPPSNPRGRVFFWAVGEDVPQESTL